MAEKDMLYCYGLKDIAGKDCKITKVYPLPYRTLYNETTKKTTEYFQFPKDERLVVLAGDELIKSRQDDTNREWRVKVWTENNGRNVREFHKFKVDGDWYKKTKKMFDIEVSFPKKTKLKKGKNDAGEFLSARVPVSASNLRKLLSSFKKKDVNSIPLVPGKNDKGEPAMVRPFDWEDAIIKSAEGVYCSIEVSGTGKETEYTWAVAEPFTVPEKEDSSFDSDFGTPEKKQVATVEIPF